jgi:hypothetical protein
MQFIKLLLIFIGYSCLCESYVKMNELSKKKKKSNKQRTKTGKLMNFWKLRCGGSAGIF